VSQQRRGSSILHLRQRSVEPDFERFTVGTSILDGELDVVVSEQPFQCRQATSGQPDMVW